MVHTLRLNIALFVFPNPPTLLSEHTSPFSLQTYLIPTGVFIWVYRTKAARDAAPKAPTRYVCMHYLMYARLVMLH